MSSVEPRVPRAGAGEFAGTDRFVVERLLGEGGMGMVYQAFDREKNTRVALKTLRVPSADAIFRLKREFRALQGIHHVNLIALGELCEAHGTWFYTMELVQGMRFIEALRDSARRARAAREEEPARPPISLFGLTPVASPAQQLFSGPAAPPPYDPTELRQCFTQLTRGLLALHHAGKIHRDVKPSNVLVTAEGRVVLLDFGLVVDSDDGLASTVGKVVGTAVYMAPEQALGQPVGPEADWYSLGVMLYEALVGAPPFLGTNVQVLMDKQAQTPVPPSARVKGVPEDLEELCMGLLHFDPARRPRARDIQRVLDMTEMPRSLRLPPLGRANATNTHAPRFVGREPELEVLEAAFAETRARRAQVTVYVHGESGIGKTTLVRRFTERAAGHANVVVLAGRCYEREAVPYKALDGVIDALAHYMQRLPEHEAVALVPQRASLLLEAFPAFKRVSVLLDAPRSHVVLDPQEHKARALVALRELFVRLTERRHVIVAIDDLQWADPDGLDVLIGLVRPPAPPPFLLVASWRPTDAVPDIEERLGALPGEIRHLRLAPLSGEAARDLAQLLLEQASDTGSASPDRAEVIARAANGHPLFIDELVRHSALAPARPPGLAPGHIDLEDVLWERIQRVDPTPRRVLEVIAVAGAPVEQGDAAHAAGMDLASFGRQTALLRAVNLVRSTGGRAGDTVETYHDRVRAAVLAHIDPEVRRACHRDLARALEASGRADAEVLVEHYRKAGDPARARAHAVRAAQGAMKALAFEQAARLYQLSLELEPGPEGEANSTTMAAPQLRIALGHALASAGRGLEAARTYLAVAGAVEPGMALDLKARAAQQLVTSGHIDEGIATLSEAFAGAGLALPETPRGALATIVWQRLRLRLRGTRFTERDESSVRADELRRLDACINLGIGLAIADHIRGHAMAVRALLLALRLGEPTRLSRALVAEGAHLASSGQHERGKARLDEAEALARRLKEPLAMAFVAGGRGQIAFVAGDFAEAVRWSEQAEADLLERCQGATWELASVRLWANRGLLWLGEYARLAQRLPAILEECARRNDLYGATSLRVSIAPFLQLAADDPAGARAVVDDAIGRWSPRGFHVQHYYALVARASAHLYEGRPEEAHGAVLKAWRELERAQLLRVQFIHLAMLDLRARSAIARSRVTRSPELLAGARRDATRMLHERRPFATGLATLLEAAVRRAESEPAKERASLEQAIAQLDAAQMGLHAAAARRRLGALVGGSEGDALVARAEAWMHKQGITRPARMSALFLPGDEP